MEIEYEIEIYLSLGILRYNAKHKSKYCFFFFFFSVFFPPNTTNSLLFSNILTDKNLNSKITVANVAQLNEHIHSVHRVMARYYNIINCIIHYDLIAILRRVLEISSNTVVGGWGVRHLCFGYANRYYSSSNDNGISFSIPRETRFFITL